MMKRNRNNAYSAGIGYTIANILVKGINFISIPLFSRILSQAEFGVYNVFIACDAIVTVIVGFALHTSVRSAHYEFPGETDKYISSISLLYIFNALFLEALILFFKNSIEQWIGLNEFALLLLVPYGFGGAILTLYNERLSLSYSYNKYLIISLANALGNILLSLLFIFTIFSDRRDDGRIIGATIALLLIAIIIVVHFYYEERPKIRKQYWSFGLKYSLPIVPHGVSQVLLAQVDRLMISSLVNNTYAGIYSLAGNIKLILTVISASIATAWNTWFYQKISVGDKNAIQKNAMRLVFLFALLTIALMAFVPEIIRILGGKSYLSGQYVAIPMIIDAYVLFIYNTIVPSEYYTKQTVYIMVGTMVAAIINIITNYFFIKQYGYIAAAYTTLFSYLCYLALHFIISRKLVHFDVIPLKWVVISIIAISVVGMIDLLFMDRFMVRIIVFLIIYAAFMKKLVVTLQLLKKELI